MIAWFRRRLRWKLFFSYLAVVLVGATVLIGALEFSIPRAFERHFAVVETMPTGGHQMGNGGRGSMASDLFVQFRTAVTEATLIALAAAGLVAAVIGALISQRVIAPVRDMMHAGRQIAQGDFSRRVALPADRSVDDLDEIGQLANSFNQMATQLEETETLRRRLIGDVTHELNTPLTVIKGSMEGLIDGILPADNDTFQMIQHEAARLQRLVTDLQELSRVEAGAYELQRKPTDLGVLVQKVQRQLQRQFEDKGVRLQVHLPTGLLMAAVDDDRMAQVLINLIGNGLQYTPAGGQVAVRVRGKDGGVQFSVEDTGSGIAPEHLPHLFTRFYRVDKSRSRPGGGSGIGLTIAQRLVEAHGGRIWVESEGLGRGAQFYFWIPLNNS